MKAQLCKIYLGVLPAVLNLAVAQAQVLSSFAVSKSGYYVQNGDSPPVPETGNNHYFEVQVDPVPNAEIDGAFVQTPSGGQIDLTQSFYYFDGFTSQAALDSQFRSGTYTFQATTSDLDFFSAQLSLSGSFPTVPRLMNYAAAQSINVSSDFTLRWEAIAGGTANDLVQVEVDDTDGLLVFGTPSFGE